MLKNNLGKLCLFLFIALTTGVYPLLAQNFGALNRTSDEFLEESRRLAKLAEEAFSEADYDRAVKLADQAAFLAIDAVNIALNLLEERGSSVGKSSPPMAPPAALPNSPAVSPDASSDALPAAYTVRPWSVSKDCFWNIAGFPWVYGNPHQWRLLYNANKSKLPNPDDPNIIEPGTVLDIPSIKGELRQGVWESGKTYEALK